MRDLLVLHNRLLVNLLNPVLKLFVLVQKKLGVVGSLGRVVGGDQLLQLHLQLLILQSVLLDLNLPVLELSGGLLELVLGLPELVALLLEHVGEQLDLLVLVLDHLNLVFGDNLALGLSHGGLLFVGGGAEAAILLLPLEQDEMLLLQSIVLFLELAHLPLELLDLLNVLLVDLHQGLVLRGLVVSELSLALVHLNNTSEEALVLYHGRSEVAVLHEVYVLHLSDHGLVFVTLQVLQRWQVQDLLGVWQIGYVVTFIQLSQLVDNGHA